MIRTLTVWLCAAAVLVTPVAARATVGAVPGAADPAPSGRAASDPAFAARSATAADSAGTTRHLPAMAVPPPDRSLKFFAGGAGLLGGLALAVILKGEADDNYAAYLATADRDAARRYYDEAEHYDRLSLIGWGLAQVSLVYLFYLFTREEERPLVPTEGEPVVRMGPDGVQFGLTVTP